MLKQIKLLDFLRTATHEEISRYAPKALATVLYLLEKLGPEWQANEELESALFLTDMEHYREHLKPITECTYIALEYGPCPVLTIEE